MLVFIVLFAVNTFLNAGAFARRWWVQRDLPDRVTSSEVNANFARLQYFFTLRVSNCINLSYGVKSQSQGLERKNEITRRGVCNREELPDRIAAP